MLYPQSGKLFSEKLFQNPGSEYRGTPFWAWNCRLDAEELTWQLEQLKAMGFGGAHFHVRTGMSTTYLSDEFMALIRACVEKCRDEGMLVWLYDEDRWPSGAAGGIVTKNLEYRQCQLLLTRRRYGTGSSAQATGDASALSDRAENGELLACFDVILRPDGTLDSYRTVSENEKCCGEMLYAYRETALPSGWYNNQTYADTLNPRAIAEFLRVTHDRYAEELQADFGKLIPAIFTDEPQFTAKGALPEANSGQDVILPWTPDLEETYKAAFPGDSLLASLPELLWELPEGRVSRVRYRYHDHVAERFASAFADQCGAWCRKHGIMLTGHMMSEESLISQTIALGDAMRSYRAFGLPGIDMLCDRREFTTAKQAQSAARQYGAPGVMSELYGVTNWNFDFRGHKLAGDWQAALGVTVRVPHLSWVSMKGEAKRDYPGTFNYQAPWYREYPLLENHYARLNTVLTRGEAVCRVAVVHPVESYWLRFGDLEHTGFERERLDNEFHSLCEWLLKSAIDFDYLCESTLPGQCPADADMSAGFPVGAARYDIVVVPSVLTLRGSTYDRLCRFRDAGGRILFIGGAPEYVDAGLSPLVGILSERCETIPNERGVILSALEPYRLAAVAAQEAYVHQLRRDGDGLWFFLAHAEEETEPDAVRADNLTVTLDGEWDVTEYRTMDGTRHAMPSVAAEGKTTVRKTLYNHDSLLLRLTPRTAATVPVRMPEQQPRLQAVSLPEVVPVTLAEPNVLLLDKASYALDGGAWQPELDILKLDNRVREALGWRLRSGAHAQPWAEEDAGTPHTLRLRCVLRSDRALTGLRLALEDSGLVAVTLNGIPAGKPDGRWYVDKSIGTLPLPPLPEGESELVVAFPYGLRTDVENMYLLGDFGVTVNGASAILTTPVRGLRFGDITSQGLPFYGGNLTYHLRAEGETLVLTVPRYRGQMLRAAVDGVDRGPLAFAPYRMELCDLGPGEHRIDITLFGNRINTFGQLHRVDRVNRWWGPKSWRSEGDGWSETYMFWEQGATIQLSTDNRSSLRSI